MAVVFAILAHLKIAHLKPTAKQVACVAEAVYHEARGEPVGAQIAVAYTVINRTQHPDFASTPCEVIEEPGQFQWQEKRRGQKDVEAWHDSVEVAALVSTRAIEPTVEGRPVFFAEKRSHPRWSKSMKRLAQIGSLTFWSDRK